jgi:hypothetical protein
MTNNAVLPRLFHLVLAFAIVALALAAAPASGLAAPPEGSGSALVVSPSPVAFPKTTVGDQTPLQAVDLANESEEEAAIEKVYLDGDDAADFNFNGHNCGTLFQDQHCSVWIGFKPASPGDKQATVHVQFSGGRSEQTFAVSGSAVPVQLAFGPDGHDFGIQQIYSSSEFQFQLANAGEASVQLNNLDIVGPDSSVFWTGYSDCWSHRIEPGQSCTVGVNFGPRDAVPYAAAVRATANGESTSAELTGVGGRAVIDAVPNPVDFGAATVGAGGPMRTVTLTNSGILGSGIFMGVVAGGDAGSFRLLDESCSGGVLEPGESCVAHLSFAPLATGTRHARLAFFGDSEGGAQIPLLGVGVAAAVTLVPASHDFGAQAAGSRGPAHAFAVRNDGATALDLESVLIAGADVDQFVLAGDECSGATLAPGEQCLLRVRFGPESTGFKSASLRVAGEAGSFAAALSGQGTGATAARSRAHWRHRVRAGFRRGKALSAFSRRAGLGAARAIDPRG